MAEEKASNRNFLLEVVRQSPMLAALQEEPLPPRELRDRLDVSKSTAHRNAHSLADRGLLRKSDGKYTLTEFGRAVVDVVVNFEEDMATITRLAPVFEAVAGIEPPCPLRAFEDATVTSTESGDPFGPLARFVSLVQETDSLRMFDSYAIAPTYMDEIHRRILDGMETYVIERHEIAEDIMKSYPRKCVRLCASEYFTPKLIDDLPFGLVIFDHRIGIGVRDSESGTPHAFVDTAAPEARDWAEAVFDSYWNESTRLERFNPVGLKETIDSE